MCDTTEYIPYVLCDGFFGDNAMSKIDLTARTAPGTPTSGKGTVYFSSADKTLHVIDDTGADTALGGGGGDTATPFVVDASGSTSYATVQSAIDAAYAEYLSSGVEQVVLVRPGTYTENLTLKPGVGVSGLLEYHPGSFPPYAIEPSTVIVGEHVITETLGVISGSVSNLSLKQPAAAVNTPACLVKYGSGGAPTAGVGSFQFVNVLFDQSAGAFDESAFVTDKGSALNDTVAFCECVFWVNTPSTKIDVLTLDSGASGSSDRLSVSMDRCQITGSWAFDPARVHDAVITMKAGACFLVAQHSFFSGARLELMGAKTSFATVEDCEILCAESGKSAISSVSVLNSLTIDDSTIKVNIQGLTPPQHAIENPLRLELGAVSFVGFDEDVYPPTTTYIDDHARLNRGAHQGSTIHVTGGTPAVQVPTHAAMVSVDTSAGVQTVNLPDPERVQGQIICVYDSGSNANAANITVGVDTSGSINMINKKDQVATYMAIEKSPGGTWVWLRVSQLVP